jgi:hypothetical protein
MDDKLKNEDIPSLKELGLEDGELDTNVDDLGVELPNEGNEAPKEPTVSKASVKPKKRPSTAPVKPAVSKDVVKKTVAKKAPVKEMTPAEKTNEARLKANATAAIAAAASAQSRIASNEADKTYIIQKKKHMLNRCKNDDTVEFVGLRLYAQFFGPVYTFLYNTIPVTVKFDGSKQKFPRFIYNHIMKKIAEVSDSNTNKDETFVLGSN